jgi:hypothetical protein
VRSVAFFAGRLRGRAEEVMNEAAQFPVMAVCHECRLSMTVRNCTRDEGGPFEVGNQVLISSHRKLLSSKAMVVSVAETAGQDLSAVLVGHYAYYGITGNSRRLQEYRYQVVRIWQKWLERRTRGKLLTWAVFSAFLARHPLPLARIIHRYTRWNEALP